MRTLLQMLLTVSLIGLTALSAWSAPSFGGYTGLINVPNADALAPGAFNVGWVDGQLAGVDFNNFFINYGMPAAEKSNVEIGVNVMDMEGSDKDTLLNAKWAVKPETEAQMGISVGVIDATNMNETTLYFVGSKVLTKGPFKVFGGEILNPRISIGLGGGGLDGLFAGLTAGLGNSLALMAEYDSNDVNLGARLRLYKGIAVQANWLDIGGEDDLGIGVYYSASR